MRLMSFISFLSVALVSACSSVDTSGVKDYRSPEHTQRVSIPDAQEATLVQASDIGKVCSSPANFQLPPGFVSNALDYCTGVYEEDSLNPDCPMRRQVLLARVAPQQQTHTVDNVRCDSSNVSCDVENDEAAAERFSQFLAGINRFEVLPSRGVMFNWVNEVGTAYNSYTGNSPHVRPVDYVLNIVPAVSVRSTPSDIEGAFFDTDYHAIFRVQVLDVRSRTVASAITIPEISVHIIKTTLVNMSSGEVRYRNYDPRSETQVDTVYQDIYRKGFAAIANHLMYQFPAVARVTALNSDIIVLDRGRLEGLSASQETMLIFQKRQQLAEPLLIASVVASQSGASGGSQGSIACWNTSTAARLLNEQAQVGEISGLDRKLYAVSIAPPPEHSF